MTFWIECSFGDGGIIVVDYLLIVYVSIDERDHSVDFRVEGEFSDDLARALALHAKEEYLKCSRFFREIENEIRARRIRHMGDYPERY
jgi:hypothetical protein